MKAVFMYDITGFMAKPWLDNGYECWIFDGQHLPGITREGNLVKVGMWFSPSDIENQAKQIAEMVGPGVKMVFGFPECTHLTVAGARHFETKRAANPKFQEDAISLCLLVPAVAKHCKTDCWAFENPVGVISTLWRKPDFSFNPSDYGGYLAENDSHPLYPEIYPSRDAYNKKTCIWCGAGFNKPRTKPVNVLDKANPGWKLCGGKSLKTKNIRSSTPRGFATAVYESNS